MKSAAKLCAAALACACACACATAQTVRSEPDYPDQGYRGRTAEPAYRPYAGSAQGRYGADQAPASLAAEQKRAAEARYKEDLRLCDDEPQNRTQCRRDARENRDRELASLAQDRARRDSYPGSSNPDSYSYPNGAQNSFPAGPARALPPCSYSAPCGKVESVFRREIQNPYPQPEQAGHADSGFPAGAVVGGLLGGALGNQVGRGNGRALATIAAAAAGAYAGNRIQESQTAQPQGAGPSSLPQWEVRARMQDGSSRSYTYSSDPGLAQGMRVQEIDGTLAPR